MSPRLKPLLLPQLVRQRQTAADAPSSTTMNLDQMELPYADPAANSSSSDIVSPVTPVFSPNSHPRFSGSSSSLELPMQAQPDCPSSPSLASTVSSVRHLADVEEEDPMQQRHDDTEALSTDTDSFGLYSCLCDQACSHRNSVEAEDRADFVSEFDIDYDMGFLSDGECVTYTQPGRKKRNAAEAAFAEFASKLGSRMPTIRRWQSSKRATLRASPTVCLSVENVLSHEAASSRSSSVSASNTAEQSLEAMSPPMSSNTSSLYSLGDDAEAGLGINLTAEDRSNLARDRSMATTPLLPPLVGSALALPPKESPLQSPKIESCPAAMEPPLSPTLVPTPPFARPPLSACPSSSSLRRVASTAELPLVLPAILQEHDEWSDRLGHANFTISPQPYELDGFGPDAIIKFRKHWDLARVNYTKHLVRTGENYGQTSKIYVLTEAKWAEIEGRWRTILEGVLRNSGHSTLGPNTASRNQSRGRGRGRSSSSNAAALGRQPAQDDLLAELEWRRVEDCLPSAVPQMLESLNADGKFPGRGDEDIVGPMQRDAVMARGRSQDAKGRFWKTIADKVGLRK